MKHFVDILQTHNYKISMGNLSLSIQSCYHVWALIYIPNTTWNHMKSH